MWIIGLMFEDGKFVCLRIEQPEPLICAHPDILQMVFIDCINAVSGQAVGILVFVGVIADCFVFEINDALYTLCMLFL